MTFEHFAAPTKKAATKDRLRSLSSSSQLSLHFFRRPAGVRRGQELVVEVSQGELLS
jgi:hypothetical protein